MGVLQRMALAGLVLASITSRADAAECFDKKLVPMLNEEQSYVYGPGGFSHHKRSGWKLRVEGVEGTLTICPGGATMKVQFVTASGSVSGTCQAQSEERLGGWMDLVLKSADGTVVFERKQAVTAWAPLKGTTCTDCNATQTQRLAIEVPWSKAMDTRYIEMRFSSDPSTSCR